MSQRHEGDVRGFYQLSRSYYNKVLPMMEGTVDEVTFGFYSPDGGTSGEMMMHWFVLGNRNTAKLEVFRGCV